MDRNKLKNKAKAYNRKARRKQIIKHLKQIREAIKKRANFGMLSESWNFTKHGTSNFKEIHIAFRLFKLKYKNFDVAIREFQDDENGDFEYIEKIWITIKWN